MDPWNHFAVVGRSEFPMDMLRYDCCFPVNGESVSAIDSCNLETRVVELASTIQPPTVGRWASFGWTVVASSRSRPEYLHQLALSQSR